MKMETAIFAAGCFWGVQASFDQLDGVTRTTVGYTGGRTNNPSYGEVCTGRTGHAEAVRIEFEPEKIPYTDLLDHFFTIHDPTTPNRQGPDVGTQYRSAVFYRDEKQRSAALDAVGRWEKKGSFRNPIVTEIARAGAFYPAEEYHQKYFEKNGWGGCHISL
ncbi:MAG: peptide-methionine (S)-S-oxide reductase MsrA [Thermoplasmatota archaeon]